MNTTIAYFTNRRNPRFQWFADSLVRQASAADLAAMQIVIVDALLWPDKPWPDLAAESCRLDSQLNHRPERLTELETAVAGRFEYLHIPPRPTVWQGPWRQTPIDCFAASNARNTALIVADKPYLACVDDLSILAPGWLDNLRHAVGNGYVVCGAYKKLREMVVTNGELVSFAENPAGVDTRWERGSAGGIVPWSGAGLFGCSFGVPTDLAVRVDGFDAHCDGQGAEDYDFGIRLERAGGRFFYNRNMLTFESEEAHTEDASATGADKPRLAKHVPFDRLPECLKAAHPDGLMSDHVMLQALLQEPGRILPLGTNGIAELRAQWQRDRTVPVPMGAAIDWRTGEPLAGGPNLDADLATKAEGLGMNVRLDDPLPAATPALISVAELVQTIEKAQEMGIGQPPPENPVTEPTPADAVPAPEPVPEAPAPKAKPLTKQQKKAQAKEKKPGKTATIGEVEL